MENNKKYSIYKISSPNTENVYIGITSRPLKKRFNEHLKNAIKIKNGTKSHEIIAFGSAKIELVEECGELTKDEKKQRETFHIKNTPNCVNVKNRYESQKEYYDSNKDKCLKYQQNYNEINKDNILKQQKDYYNTYKDNILKYQHKYYELNKDNILKQQKEYRMKKKDPQN